MIELLAAIVILGVLSITAIVSVTHLITKSKDEKRDQMEKTAVMATQSYFQANTDELPKAIGESRTISLNELKSANYLKNNFKDANGKSCMERSYVKVYKKSNSDYTYTAYIYCEGDPEEDNTDTVNRPDVDISFEGDSNAAGNLQNVSTAYLVIEIKGDSESETAIEGYSYSLSVQTKADSYLREVYNSGTLKGNGQTTVSIRKPITDYIDITDLTLVKAKVIARNVDGGYYSTEGEISAGESTPESDSYHDETNPICKEISGQAEPNQWINSKSGKRTIYAICDDGDGSGCIRDRFYRTWPNDKQTDAEWAYIQVKDNAKNVNIDDNYIDNRNPCAPAYREDTCRVRVNVDSTYPGIKVEAYKRTSDDKATGNNVIKSSVTSTFGDTKKSVDEYYLKANSYNNLYGNWMNQANYPAGVIYKITFKDNIHLASWSWKTNVKRVEDTNNENYEKIRTDSNTEIKSGTWKDLDPETNNCGVLTDNTITVSFADEGRRRGILTVTDKAGNTTKLIIEANIDYTKPTCELTHTGTKGTGNWYKKEKATISISRSDTGSSKLKDFGLNTSTTAAYNGKPSATQGNTPKEGIRWYGHVRDNAGNTYRCQTDKMIQVDLSAPTCKVEKSGTKGSNGWWKEQRVTLKITREDGGNSGVAKYGLVNTNTRTYDNKDTKYQDVNTTGITWYGFIEDGAGNVGSCNSGNIKLDMDAPSCSVGSYSNQCSTSGVKAVVSCSDSFSKLASCAGSSKTSHPANATTSKSGITGNTPYSVVDVAGNSSSCTAYVTPVYQTRYRTRPSWCNRCSSAGCVSGHKSCYCEVGTLINGRCYKPDTYTTEEKCRRATGCAFCENTDYGGYSSWHCGTGTYYDQVCTCSLYNSSCSYCGTSYGSWGYFTGWSRSGCYETDTRDCQYRTLYKHNSSAC